MGKGATALKQMRQQPQMTQAQIDYERKCKKLEISQRIRRGELVLAYKQAQIDSGKIKETLSVHRLHDGTAITVEGYVDNLKPKHLLEVDIDFIETNQKILQESLNHIKIAEEESAKKLTKDRD